MLRSLLIKFQLALLVLLGSGIAYTKIIVWDLGHVLFETSRLSVALYAKTEFLNYMLHGNNPGNVRKLLFDVLDAARVHEPRNTTVPDEKGNSISNVMCDFQAGTKTPAQLLEEMNQTIERMYAEGYFNHVCERDLIAKVVQTIFNPEAFAQTTRPISAGVALLQECIAQRDEQGNTVHEMMILSNWDPQSFEILKTLAHGKKVLDHFKPENMVVSGFFGTKDMLKPSHTTFKYVLSLKKDIASSEFVFIDDQIRNVEAARACGMQAIQVVDGNYDDVRQELQRLGVL